MDGKYEVLGASDCNSAYNNYLSRYNMRMSETGGNSPVGIEGTFTVFGTAGSFNATYTLLDPYTLGSVRATLFVYEEGLTYGSVTYNHVTRVIKDQTITTLINQGDQATLSIPFTAGAGWVANNLHGVAILQQTTGQKTIIQAARLTFLTDFSVTMASRIASVPEGDGWTSLQAQIKNRSAAGDVLT
ncbi:MAG: hypothetical protein FJY88_13120, partial [Candidatus Eisenbacteria bacterium]|nr:hypothetical protein [Candidatus Eisenbacteria bacterium]